MQVRVSRPARRLNDRQTFLLLSSLSLVVALAVLWMTRSTSPLRGDSAEYLYFDPSRTVGYPAFLEFVRLIAGNVALAVTAQTIILAASLLALAWSFHQLVRRPAYTIAFLVLLMANAGMWLTSAFLMTEALSTALVALWCAQLLRMIQKASTRGYAILVTLSYAAMLVRPSLVSLFVGTALFALVGMPIIGRGRRLAAASVGLFAALITTPIAQLVVHGSTQTTSPFARGVLQHTLYCEPHAVETDPDAMFVEANSQRVRRYINSAPPGAQEQLRREYSTPLRFGLIIPVLGRRHHLETRSQVDPYLAPIARARVLANPGCYTKSVGNEYLRLAAFDTDPTAEDARVVNAFVKQHRPAEVTEYPVLPGDDRLARRAALEVRRAPAALNPVRQQLHVVGDVPFLALLPLRLLYAAAALFGTFALLPAINRRSSSKAVQPLVAVSAAAGISLHATLAITAIVEVGFYRYLVPCWPLVCVIVVSLALIVRKTAPRKLFVRASTIVIEPSQSPA